MRLDRVARVYRLRERIAASAHGRALAAERLARADVDLVGERASLIDDRRARALDTGGGIDELMALEQVDAALARMHVEVAQALATRHAEALACGATAAARQRAADHVDELAAEQARAHVRTQALLAQEALASRRPRGAGR